MLDPRLIRRAIFLAAGSAAFAAITAPTPGGAAVPPAPKGLAQAPAPAPAPAAQPARKGRKALADQLTELRARVVGLEEALLFGLKSQAEAKANLKRIQELMKLQAEERTLGQKRLAELEGTISDLQVRKGQLQERVSVHQRAIRQTLADLARSLSEPARGTRLDQRERVEAPRRKALAALAERNLKEIEALKVDLADADRLEVKIQEEQGHLAYLFQDLKEQESLLELNRQMQADLLARKHQERLAQLENYRKLKGAEAQVEGMLTQFNARRELEKTVQTERSSRGEAEPGTLASAFTRMKGRLPLPIAGRVVSQFGQSFDEKTRLQIFKKGIEIAPEASGRRSVAAISGGRIAYSGELPGYGRVAIVDHGDHFYSLCGKLGELSRKVGETVKAGDAIGLTDEAGTPVYFEIRSRNIALNPLQWVALSNSL